MNYNIVIPDNLDAVGVDLLNQHEEFTLAVGPFSRAETLACISDAHAMVVRSATKVDSEMFDAANQLKVVVRAGVGVDNIDLRSAGEHGVTVMNAPDGNTIAAAEHTFALMMALARNIPDAQQSMREGRWDRKLFMGVELRGKTLGIIGLGRIGRQVAKRAKVFGMEVIAYDPPQNGAVFEAAEVEQVSADDLLRRADFLTLHAPANESTKSIIRAETIAKMKDGVRIINAARGILINPQDLAEAIKSGKVAGAALDVYPQEPPGDDFPLVGLENVVHTPHLGASTYEAQEEVARQAAAQVRDALLKNVYNNVVNQEYLVLNTPGDD